MVQAIRDAVGLLDAPLSPSSPAHRRLRGGFGAGKSMHFCSGVDTSSHIEGQ
jgi:hypothetical protein